MVATRWVDVVAVDTSASGSSNVGFEGSVAASKTEGTTLILASATGLSGVAYKTDKLFVKEDHRQVFLTITTNAGGCFFEEVVSGQECEVVIVCYILFSVIPRYEIVLFIWNRSLHFKIIMNYITLYFILMFKE
jgi:hypothetical protein